MRVGGVGQERQAAMRAPAILGAAVVACVVACAAPVAVQAEAFAVKPGSFAVVPSNTLAGAHPDLTTSFAIAQDEAGVVGGSLRNAEVVLPTGFAGYPAAVKTCDPVQLQLEACPVGSQIGTLEVATYGYVFGQYFVLLGPLFNMAPSPGQAAVYGFDLKLGEGGEVIASGEIVVSVGPDYRVHARVRDVYGLFAFVRTSLTVWGVPADPSHNAVRGDGFFCKQLGPSERFVPAEEECGGGNVAANENPVAYLVNPTQCTPHPLTAELTGLESWEGSSAPPQFADHGPLHRLRIVEVRANSLGCPRSPPGDHPHRLRSRPARPSDRRRRRARDGRPRGRGRADAGGRRALSLGGYRPGIVQRSRGRAAHRTAGGVPQRVETGDGLGGDPGAPGRTAGLAVPGRSGVGADHRAAVHGLSDLRGPRGAREDQGHGHAEPRDGADHDGLRRKPAAAVQRTETAPERRFARDGREPERLRFLRRRSRVHAVELAVYAGRDADESAL